MLENSSYPYFMEADRRPLDAGAIDIASLLGTWFNANPDTQYLVKLVFRAEKGQLWVRSYGSSDREPIDWGEVEAVPYVSASPSLASGFHAVYHLDGIETHLLGRAASGVLAIEFNTRYLDESGRSSHFTHEFFHRSVADSPLDRFLDFNSVSGIWVNSKPATQGIKQFSLRQAEDRVFFRPYGATSVEDWGETEAIPFVNATGERAFLAEYHFDSHDLHLVANTNKGLWVIAAHYVFKDSEKPSGPLRERPNFLRREFFYPANTSED